MSSKHYTAKILINIVIFEVLVYDMLESSNYQNLSIKLSWDTYTPLYNLWQYDTAGLVNINSEIQLDVLAGSFSIKFFMLGLPLVKEIMVHTVRIHMKTNVVNDTTPTAAQTLLTIREMMPMLGCAPE